MCGRYAATAHPDELVEELEVELDATGEATRSVLARPQDPPAGRPDWNMAPTKQAPVVLERPPRGSDDAGPVRQLRLLTWGLVPSWAKDVKMGLRMTNARSESLLDKPAFARAAARRRCLVPAEGWYEWQASPVQTDSRGRPRKQPFFVGRADGATMALAGLYEFWRDPDGDPADPQSWVASFTVVTRAAEPGLDRLHDRQPVVLDRDSWAAWLDPASTGEEHVREILASQPDGRFRTWPVSTAVNTTRNNGPRLMEPLPLAELHGVLDPMTGEVYR